MVASSSASASLKEYLRRYENNDEEEKKKKKKKKKVKPDPRGVIVVDEDPVWQKPVEIEEEHDDSEDEEKPQVDEDIEVKRMKRLEQVKSLRPFGAISEDGSGWVPVSDTQDLNPDDLDPDMSPPRRHRPRNKTPSPEYETKRSHHSGCDPKPLKSDDQNNDISPPRKSRARYDTPSPEPGGSKPSDRANEDLSPPRQRRRHHYTPSPEPGMEPSQSSDADPDLSPPRRRSLKEPAENKKKNSNIDTRQAHRSSSYRDDSREADLSPPRKSRNDLPVSSDFSPPRRSRNDFPVPSDLSPPRKSRKDLPVSSDLSPPRKIRKESASMTERTKTGLVTGRDVKEEIAKKKKEDWLRFKDMDPSQSGRGAEPVYRDKKTGERLTKEQVLESQKKKEEKPKEIKLEWGKGLAQKREAEARQQELELEKAKPFARTRDDPELDSMLKERPRWGDPMAHLVKKKYSEIVLADMGDNEKMKESGFIIPQEIPSHSWLKRGLDAAPNRYGIKPGRHWDGVDRSNGFEKQMFKRSNEKQATEKEAYLWSVADM
ncbi:hypothetical protein LguiB_026807 [Lonicera macranthoides]